MRSRAGLAFDGWKRQTLAPDVSERLLGGDATLRPPRAVQARNGPPGARLEEGVTEHALFRRRTRRGRPSGLSLPAFGNETDAELGHTQVNVCRVCRFHFAGFFPG
jgi:hypothetical protein